MRDLHVPRAKPEMFRGLLGRIVETFAPYTEAAPEPIAAQALIAFGSAVGPRPCIYIGETRHGASEFLLVVGRTARARKGDGRAVATSTIERADREWATQRRVSGLSSAEGLIYAVRDRTERVFDDGSTETVDEGVTDKRLLVTESEFASVLRQFERSGNTLSTLLRCVWDGASVLGTLTRSSPLRATDAHVSLIAHSTAEDLHEHLSTCDAANGLGNRFLIVATERAQTLPCPGRVPARDRELLVMEMQDALARAREIGEMHYSMEAREQWEVIYPEVSRDVPGIVGNLTARAEAHVVRLGLLYALLDGSPVIDVPHLDAALAFWSLCRASVRAIYADQTGNPTADRIIEAMLPGDRLSLTELRETVLRHNVPAARLRGALALLVETGDVRLVDEATGGRPTNVVMRRPAGGWPDAAAANEHAVEAAR